MSDVERIDITDRIRGVLKENEMILTINGNEIGRIPLDANSLEFSSGYEVSDSRIYRLDSADVLKQSNYAEDCDMGWC